MNLVMLVGRMTHDPEPFTTSTGKSKVEFGLATNEFRNGQRSTEYHNCVAWDKLADVIVNHGRSGRLLELTGRLVTRSFTTRAGAEAKKTEIVLNTMNFLDRPAEAPEAPPRKAQPRREDPEELPW